MGFRPRKCGSAQSECDDIFLYFSMRAIKPIDLAYIVDCLQERQRSIQCGERPLVTVPLVGRSCSFTSLRLSITTWYKRPDLMDS